MAVLVEAISVIVRREAISQRYPGGWAKFMSAAPNRTLCADSELARVGFMHPDDVGAYVRGLEKLGLVFVNQQGVIVDIAVVDQRQGPTGPCSWIEFFHTEVPGGTVAAVRLTGSQDGMLNCPADWRYEGSLSAQFKFYPGRQAEDLEFVRSEPHMDVFRNRTTGKEEYLARTRSVTAAEDLVRHNALYKEAAELIRPFLDRHVKSGDPRPAKSTDDQSKVRRVGELLAQVTQPRPENWNAWWILGMAHRFLGDAQAAHDAFKRAFDIAPAQIEVGRNLALESITLGHGPEAVDVTTRMVELRPDDPGLIANRALALLINGDVAGAQLDVERALKMNPGDQITQYLSRLVGDVRAGRVARPSKWPPG